MGTTFRHIPIWDNFKQKFKRRANVAKSQGYARPPWNPDCNDLKCQIPNNTAQTEDKNAKCEVQMQITACTQLHQSASQFNVQHQCW